MSTTYNTTGIVGAE